MAKWAPNHDLKRDIGRAEQNLWSEKGDERLQSELGSHGWQPLGGPVVRKKKHVFFWGTDEIFCSPKVAQAWQVSRILGYRKRKVGKICLAGPKAFGSVVIRCREGEKKRLANGIARRNPAEQNVEIAVLLCFEPSSCTSLRNSFGTTFVALPKDSDLTRPIDLVLQKHSSWSGHWCFPPVLICLGPYSQINVLQDGPTGALSSQVSV